MVVKSAVREGGSLGSFSLSSSHLQTDDDDENDDDDSRGSNSSHHDERKSVAGVTHDHEDFEPPQRTPSSSTNLTRQSDQNYVPNNGGKFLTKCWTIIGDVPLDLVVVVIVWYFVGVASICTTKILADQGVPPLVLTFQQLFLASGLLRLHLGITGELQPLPKAVVTQLSRIWRVMTTRKVTISYPKALVSKQSIDEEEGTLFDKDTSKATGSSACTIPVPSDETLYLHFGLMGVLDGLDFLCTAVGFTFANASFVETVKSSQPITTTAVALFFGIDTLQKPEALAMAVIVVGVFCSTLGNAEDAADTDLKEKEDPAVASNASMTMGQALQTVAIAITANLCFALRVNSQKKFRAHPEGREMNDTNMLMWMQRMGSFALLIPIILFDLAGVIRRTRASAFWEGLIPFWALALINAMCFSLYTLTNTFVLTKVSVGQHTGLNALRRMFVIVFTAIFFGVPITPMKTFGVVLCFTGFSAFSYYRNRTIATAGVFDAPGGRKEYDPMTAPLLDSVHTKHQQ